MFKPVALPHISTRVMLSALTATALFSVASMSNAALFKDNLPTDQDAVLSVGRQRHSRQLSLRYGRQPRCTCVTGRVL